MTVDIERHDAIKRRLRAKGVKFTDIATEVGCAASLVTMVSQGRRSHSEVEDVISRHLNEAKSALWPSKQFEEARQ
ncbi:helix-turn-helix domain-containing protein [Roseovarius sp. M141]|uniref:helix-turn-helix domain-containing protein n=1 Tax=Roseovarius sp. M141 TaxID=2583806 RepID=UPI0020CDF3E6|nr:helix-turn-helix domain-containing protein [Roseovarius sp. M141]MCQ0090249.1 DNA-binding protein [Roseovarius sp. M141]